MMRSRTHRRQSSAPTGSSSPMRPGMHRQDQMPQIAVGTAVLARGEHHTVLAHPPDPAAQVRPQAEPAVGAQRAQRRPELGGDDVRRPVEHGLALRFVR